MSQWTRILSLETKLLSHKLLVNIGAENNSKAAEILTSDIYVDDLFGGGDSEESIENQIQGSHSILSPGGFCLKYVARSRENPQIKQAQMVYQ